MIQVVQKVVYKYYDYFHRKYKVSGGRGWGESEEKIVRIQQPSNNDYNIHTHLELK